MTAMRVHQDSVVIDAVCPLAEHDRKYLDWYREGGVTTLAPTVGSIDSARATLESIAAWHSCLRERDDLLLVTRSSDVELAKRSKRLGIYFHIQGTNPIEGNLDLIDLYKYLGVGMIQLTYNVRNHVGDGCEEETGSGLSRFGVKLIERLNAARMIVDCAHTGLRTSMDAIEHSSAPVVVSHANVTAVQASARNLADPLIAAVARSGGVIGVCGFPPMVAAGVAPSLDDFIAHIDALVERAGIDSVGLGLDYYSGQVGVASDTEALRIYESAVRSGAWATSYSPPPHRYPAGIETPRTLPNLTARLLERGYREADVGKILGGNWLRIMRTVWG